MTLDWNGYRWEATCRTAENYYPRTIGFHWDGTKRVWWTGLFELAKQLEQFATPNAKIKFSSSNNQIALSRAMDSHLNFPAPKELSYLGFQKAGISYASPRTNSFNCDEMGLGKTIQAIGVCNADVNIKSILVVCPANLMLNWSKELTKWMVQKLSGDFATSTSLPNSNIVIVNYDKMAALRDKILQRKWHLHIYDEFQMLKNPDAKRTIAVLGRETGKYDKYLPPLEADKRLFLSGTPIVNRPIELFPALRVADPLGLGVSEYSFAKRFCGPNASDGDYSGASNLDALQERLRISVMIRRLKKDVLKDLPPKRRQILAVPLPALAKKAIEAEMNFYAQHEAAILTAVSKAEAAQAAGDKESFNAASRDLKDIHSVMFHEMARLRHDTGVAKVPFLIQHIETVLQEVQKLVVFCHHHDVMNPIAERFGTACVQHNGTMSIQQRDLSVWKYENDPNVRLFVGGITTAQGYTIVAGSNCIIGEEDWRPSIVTQAEDRLHRIGQKMHVLIQHFVFDGSLDARMVKRTVEKQEIADAALDTIGPFEGGM